MFGAGPGACTVRDIAGLCVYDNTLLAGVVIGAQLRDYLECSARCFRQAPAAGQVDPGG